MDTFSSRGSDEERAAVNELDGNEGVNEICGGAKSSPIRSSDSAKLVQLMDGEYVERK